MTDTPPARARIAVPLLILALAAPAAADDFVVTFEEDNDKGWTFQGIPYTGIDFLDGNPRPSLSSHCPDGQECVEAVGVEVRALPLESGQVVGDFRARGVSSMGCDAILRSVSIDTPPTPMSLILYSDRGTPTDSNDDLWVWNVGPTSPRPGEGWTPYDFAMPSGSQTLPQGWTAAPDRPLAGDDEWNAVITNVTLAWFYWNKHGAFILPPRVYDAAVDTMRITADLPGQDPCYGDCDGSTGDRVLDFFDFLCFQNIFNAQKPYADCNGDGEFDLFDFLCFTNAFNAGC
jgi:hypothetical protein